MSLKIIIVIVLLITATLLPLILSDATAGNGFGNCISPTRARLNDVQMLSATNGWAVGDSGTIIHWGGSSWSNVTSPTEYVLYGLHMLGASDGWAVGWYGTIVRWNNSQSRWDFFPNPFYDVPPPLSFGSGRYLSSIFMLSTTSGWAVGKDWHRSSTFPYAPDYTGDILRWDGSAWTLAFTSSHIPLSVFMSTENNGWIVGEDGYIAHWDGSNWITVSSPTSTNLNCVYMYSTNEGWAVGDNGTILRYNGSYWATSSSPTFAHLRSVHALNSNSAWTVGDNGTVIKWDGSWKNCTSSTKANLRAVSMISGPDGFATGENGTILRLDNYSPHTTATYEDVDQWHQSDVLVTLTAVDNATAYTGIDIIYYKINGGDLKNVTTDGGQTATITITTESDNNNVTYWSVDKAGNQESPANTAGGIRIDKTPPTCTLMQILGGTTLPDGIAFTGFTNVTVSLKATDGSAGSGAYQMRFRNDNEQDWSDWEAYSEGKEWNLTNGDGPKKVQAQFKDNAGWISELYNATITVDTLPPVLQIVSPLNTQNGTEVKASSFKLEWSSSDAGQIPTNSYEVKQDSGDWVSLGNSTTSYTFTGLGDGEHLLQIRTNDTSGKSSVYSLKILANTSPIGGPGYLEESLIGVAAGIAVAAPIVYKWRKRPKAPPSPKTLKLQADPTEVIADRQSKSTITVQLLDGSGKPIVAPGDIEVKLNASKGKIETPVVTIPKGKDTEKTYLISSVEIGPATVSADAKGLKSLGLTLNFVEKKRYCMHCGSIMPFTAKLCQKCGNSPPAGVDTKACMNCESVIPVVAKFCSECGAGQTESRTD